VNTEKHKVLRGDRITRCVRERLRPRCEKLPCNRICTKPSKECGNHWKILNRNSVEKSEGNTNNGRLGFFMIISDFLFLYTILKFSVIGAYLLH
jgi:hypothetical protein